MDPTREQLEAAARAGLLRYADVAERFGVSTRTVQRWAAKGAFATQRTVGGHTRIVDNEDARPRRQRS